MRALRTAALNRDNDPNPKGSPLIEFGALLATVLGGVTVRFVNAEPARRPVFNIISCGYS